MGDRSVIGENANVGSNHTDWRFSRRILPGGGMIEGRGRPHFYDKMRIRIGARKKRKKRKKQKDKGE